ncbi:hypothetical protein FisN_24Lh062 [Fistulifera solaris]|uniref:Uncharacterized protein n=1 Tax=Fistulifera solaris TaxID=1519565 RepID=A0A1Z5K9K3_FISSO|nr:hypothetical protein FisN_24Lh062 [Fistulifera solaris]|eukprot:GAX22791.1 hypothetical protein FisN_24Lh062 [Fistulifera solaris]
MAISETPTEGIVSQRKSFWSRFRRQTKNNERWPSVSQNNKAISPHHPVVNEQAPTAREAAFSGPPRYDWMDIETAAAIQIQAAYRRHHVLQQLEKEGHLTAPIRQRQQLRSVPNLLACCGVGFLFDYNDELERQEHYSRQKQERADREAQLRDQFLRKQRQCEAETPVIEAFEVVE